MLWLTGIGFTPRKLYTCSERDNSTDEPWLLKIVEVLGTETT
jgi:hypothetical protein